MRAANGTVATAKKTIGNGRIQPAKLSTRATSPSTAASASSAGDNAPRPLQLIQACLPRPLLLAALAAFDTPPRVPGLDHQVVGRVADGRQHHLIDVDGEEAGARR